MILVKTYIKSKNGFVKFNDYTEEFENLNYIEGAIELTINGVTLLTKEMWDYIVDLWAYIYDGIDNIRDKKPFETYFPDQHIKVSFIPIKESVYVSVNCHFENKVKVDKKEFIHEMTKHAITFFEYLNKKRIYGHRSLFAKPKKL